MLFPMVHGHSGQPFQGGLILPLFQPWALYRLSVLKSRDLGKKGLLGGGRA